MVRACAVAEGGCTAAAGTHRGEKQPGRCAQGGSGVVVARRASAPVLLHARLVSNRRGAVQIDRAEISAEQCGCRRRDTRANMAWVAGTSGGWSAQVGGDEQRFVA